MKNLTGKKKNGLKKSNERVFNALLRKKNNNSSFRDKIQPPKCKKLK